MTLESRVSNGIFTEIKIKVNNELGLPVLSAFVVKTKQW